MLRFATLSARQGLKRQALTQNAMRERYFQLDGNKHELPSGICLVDMQRVIKRLKKRL